MHRIRIEIDIGRSATVGQVAAVTSDFSATTDLATRWRERSLKAEVERDLDGGNGQILGDLTRSFELSPSEQSTLSGYVELVSDLERLDHRPPPVIFEELWERSRRGTRGPQLLAALLAADGAPPKLSSFDAALFEKLVALQCVQRSEGPPIVESLSYRNPWETIVVAGLGAVGGGALTSLLTLLRDWQPNRRMADAGADRAEAEARSARAKASLDEQKLVILQRAQASLSDDTDGQQLSLADLDSLLDESPEAIAAVERLMALNPTTEVLPELAPGIE